MKEAEMAIAALDSDGDGLLSLEDFVTLMEGGGEEQKLKDLKVAFEMYDTEGCGFITPKSLKRMLKKMGESKTLHQCKAMIKHFDLNGDGFLSFQEFRIMMQWLHFTGFHSFFSTSLVVYSGLLHGVYSVSFCLVHNSHTNVLFILAFQVKRKFLNKQLHSILRISLNTERLWVRHKLLTWWIYG